MAVSRKLKAQQAAQRAAEAAEPKRPPPTPDEAASRAEGVRQQRKAAIEARRSVTADLQDYHPAVPKWGVFAGQPNPVLTAPNEEADEG